MFGIIENPNFEFRNPIPFSDFGFRISLCYLATASCRSFFHSARRLLGPLILPSKLVRYHFENLPSLPFCSSNVRRYNSVSALASFLPICSSLSCASLALAPDPSACFSQ